MEATSDYWKPVFFLLEREGFECPLYQASQVKALPGRPKTDKLDSAWLAMITERGSLAGSFVPPEEIRRLRTYTRYRRRLVQARTAQKARSQKLLEDAHLKLSSVISDIHGVSGRAMLRAIIAASATRQRSRRWLGPGCAEDRPAGGGPDRSFLTPGTSSSCRGCSAASTISPPRSPSWTRRSPSCATPRRAGRPARRHPRVLGHRRPGPDRRDRHRHERVPDRRAPGLLGRAGCPRPGSAGQRKGKSATGRGNPYIGGTLGETAASAGRTQPSWAPSSAACAGTCPRRKPRAPS